MKFQVVILAGGKSSRFAPFNNLHKSFFTFGGKTIIQRTLEDVFSSLDTEIILVLGSKNFGEEKKIIEDYGYGEKITYVKQEESLGQGNAILSASSHLKENFFVINSQHFNFSSLAGDFVDNFEKDTEAVVGFQKTDTPWKYGVLGFRADGKPSGVIEKPDKRKEPSDKRVVGVYLLTQSFLERLSKIEQSEYNLEEALDSAAKDGKLLATEISTNLPSLKYPWDLLDIKKTLLNEVSLKTNKSAQISKTATIKGAVYIGEDSKICDYALIEGPVYIGKNTVVGSYCQVRGGSFLEEGSVIQRYADIKNSIIGKNSSVHSGFIGDSVVGENVKIGAGFITANKRFDRTEIDVGIKGKKVNSGKTGLGVLVGNNANIGIRVSTMPGAIVKSDNKVYPGEIIK